MQNCRDCEWFIDLKHEDENEVYDGLCCCPDLRNSTEDGAPYASAKGEWEACKFFEEEKGECLSENLVFCKDCNWYVKTGNDNFCCCPETSVIKINPDWEKCNFFERRDDYEYI